MYGGCESSVVRVNESVTDAEESMVETVTVTVAGELTADKGGVPVNE